jgi:hypothetical protein
MDPDECLRTIREIVKRIEEEDDIESDLPELADAFESLDLWLSKGGFLPDDWKDANKSR